MLEGLNMEKWDAYDKDFNKIRLGSLCITKITKTFKIEVKGIIVPKGTYVTVCDDDIKEGFVLVE